ncbi:FHA domain-containing protein [Candidatus Sumerlaeota bacterium]|nr:FHA domain-containing protein [Candidatus Sumerlaeota bacterium]
MSDAYILLASGKKFELTKDSNSVGRVPENDIQIDDQSISRNHATLKREGDTWYVEDLGAKNKTFVNEKPIEPNNAVAIKDGTTLHFGYVAVKFHLKKAAQSGNETLAVDLNNPDIAAMFKEASSKSDPRPAAAGGFGGGGGGGVEEMRSSKRAFAYLELRSVTNPLKFSIEKEAVLIGTDAGECDIRVIDSTASPVHAEIRFLKGKKIQLKNMSQETGTQLNGRRIGKAFIKEGDQIDIGDSSFTFHFVDWPDISNAQESGATTAARFIIIMLVVVVLGVGAYFAYKMGYLLPKSVGQTGQVAAGGGGSQTAGGAGSTADVSTALDLVTQKRYDDANDMLIRILKNPPADAGDIRAMQEDLAKLRSAKDRLDQKDYIGAYIATKTLDFNTSQIGNRATDVQREVLRRYREAVAAAKSDYEKAEISENWDEALRKIAVLKQTGEKAGEDAFENAATVLPAAEARIKAKQELLTAYNAAVKDLNASYSQIGDDLTMVLDRTEAKTSQDPQLKADIAKYVTKVESARAHAQLLKVYFNFDGQNIEEARKLRNAVAVDYAGRDDVNRRLTTLEKVSTLYNEYLGLLADYKANPDQNKIKFYDSVIEKLEGILAAEGDARFELSKTAASEIAQLREAKKKDLLEAFNKQPAGPFATGIRGELERLLAERQRWYEYLQLFSLNVRDNRYKDLVLNDELKDEEIVKRFKDAYDRYDRARSEVLKVIVRNWQESTDLGLKKDSLTFIDRLQSMTLPEDKDTEKAILAVRNQLR